MGGSVQESHGGREGGVREGCAVPRTIWKGWAMFGRHSLESTRIMRRGISRPAAAADFSTSRHGALEVEIQKRLISGPSGTNQPGGVWRFTARLRGSSLPRRDRGGGPSRRHR